MKTFTKTGIVLTAFCLCGLLVLTGCGGRNNQPDASADTSGASSSIEIQDEQTPTAVVTDVQLSEPEVHEVLLPQDFSEGEVIDNPYYKRTTDENGVPVFAVKQASNGQQAYLPFDVTTVYHADGPCYFERMVLTYKLDDVEKTTIHYDLYVADVLQEASTDVNQAAGATSAGADGSTGAVDVDGNVTP